MIQVIQELQCLLEFIRHIFRKISKAIFGIYDCLKVQRLLLRLLHAVPFAPLIVFDNSPHIA